MDKVLIPQPIAESGIDFLKEKGYDILYVDGTDEEAFAEAVKECSAVHLGLPRMGRKIMEQGTHLKIIARQGTGCNNVDLQAAQDLGIWVTNAPDATTTAVAEFTIGGLVSLAKNMYICTEKMKEGDFDSRNRYRGEDLRGKTLSIIGYGRIGRTVARMAHFGLDMNILAYGPHLTQDKAADYVKAVDWDTAFREGDFVSLHMPLNDSSRRSIGKREFDLMKPKAKLINMARAAVIVENDLMEALNSGKLGGLFTDVFESEPVDKDDPLLHMDNVLVTPHMASSSKECQAEMALFAAKQIHKVLSGEEPDTPVNHPVRPRARIS